MINESQFFFRQGAVGQNQFQNCKACGKHSKQITDPMRLKNIEARKAGQETLQTKLSHQKKRVEIPVSKKQQTIIKLN